MIAYYLGVKTLEDAVAALERLSFVKVLDPSALTIEITGIDRITVLCAPASEDKDFAKGVIVFVGGELTPSESQEVESLEGLADKTVTLMAEEFVVRTMVEFQKSGNSGTHVLLGQARDNAKGERP